MLLPGGSQGRGAWWAAVYGVAQSDTTEGGGLQQEAIKEVCLIHISAWMEADLLTCQKLKTLIGPLP